MTEIGSILRSMANSFADLADKIEQQDNVQRGKIAYLEGEVVRNKDILRKVADLIIGELGD